jgi:hypothetical protein
MPPTVVILLSDKRSGSTIFQKEFAKHSAVQTLRYSSHTYLESHHWTKAATMLGGRSRRSGFLSRDADYGGPRNARTYMIDTVLGNLPDFTPQSDDKALIFGSWEALCREFARPVFFEKSPQLLANWSALSLLLEWKAQTSFCVRFIGLVRNPLAVQHSAEVLFGTPPELRQFAWAKAYRNLLALQHMIPPEDILVMRHEDIIADPSGRLAEICAFVGLVPQPGLGVSVTTERQNSWLQDECYTLRLAPVVREVARAFGYSAGDLTNPHSATSLTKSARKNFRPLQLIRNRLRDRHLRPLLMRWRQPRHLR